MEKNNLKAVILGRIEAIMGAEKITRAELSAISRELLMYVPDTNDINMVNRLIGVLTPMNRKAAILYFGHFLPWQQEKDNDGNFTRFGKKFEGDKKVKKRLDMITEWLSDEENNIWKWSEANIEIKQKDFKTRVTNAIKQALKGDEKSNTPALTQAEVIASVFDGGITLDEMVAAMASRVEVASAQDKEPVEMKEAA